MASEKAPGFLFNFPNEGVEVLSPVSEAPGLTCLIKHRACLINAGQRTLIFSVASQGRGRTEPDGSHGQGEEAADPQQLPSLGLEPQALEKLAHWFEYHLLLPRAPPSSFSGQFRRRPAGSWGSTRKSWADSNPFLPFPARLSGHCLSTSFLPACPSPLQPILGHTELAFCMFLALTPFLGPGPSHPPPCYLQSVVHGLPVRDQLIEGRQVKVLAEQPQGHQLICWYLEEKAVINIHLQPVSWVPWVSHELIPGDQVHRYFQSK